MKTWVGVAIVAELLLVGIPMIARADTSSSEPTVVARYKVGGVGGWDLAAFDDAHRRVFVSHSDRVVVLDADTGRIMGEITGTEGVHAIAIAPELNRGFTSNGATNSLTEFDLDTLRVIGKVAVTGQNPDALLYDPFSKRIFSFNGRSANATVVEAKTLKVVNTIALPGKPELAVSDRAGQVFVNLEDKSQIAVLDATTGALKHAWSIAPGEEPTGLAIDVEHQRLFAVCSNQKLIVLDADSGRVVQQVPIGDGPDSAAFDPTTNLVYSSNGQGTLTVVHEDDAEHFRVIATVPTQKSARTMALDSFKHRIYLPAAEVGPLPAPSAEHPHPRPSIIPNTFSVIVVGG